MSKKILLLGVPSLLALPLLYSACSGFSRGAPSLGGTTTGTPVTPLAIASYSSNSGLKLCMKSLSLKSVGGGDVNLEFSVPQEQIVSPSGIELESFLIPHGTYSQISLVTADACGTNRSVDLINGQGTFKTSDPVVFKFEGLFEIGSASKKVNLQIQSIANVLDTVTSNSELPTKATANTGSLSLGSCGMQLADLPSTAFCETFDHPFAATGRSGQMDGTLWGVSRLGSNNPGQNLLNYWSPSSLDACDGSHPAGPDSSDVTVCSGQMRESSFDSGGPTALAFTSSQAFDFGGRTGTIAFDVSNNTSGPHGVWPEIWLTDQAVPSPHLHGNSPADILSIPRNGIAVSFAANVAPGLGGLISNCPIDNNPRWAVDTIKIIKNYAVDETAWYEGKWQSLGCVISSPGPNGALNHIELRISQGQIEVWAADAGSAILKIMARYTNANLSFTKGFISLEDSHLDASQSADPTTVNHTFSWDNIAFDGPAAFRDLRFDVIDALTVNGDGTINLGYLAKPAAPAQLTSLPITAANIAAAKSALLVFNFGSNPLATINYVVNGQNLSVPSPVPSGVYWNSVAVPVPVSSLVVGSQAIKISGDVDTTVTNVSIILVDASPVP